jgi:hypothetical protein
MANYLNNVSNLSFEPLCTVFIARPSGASSEPDKKLSFTGSFKPINAGISKASVAEVRILFLIPVKNQ